MLTKGLFGSVLSSSSLKIRALKCLPYYDLEVRLI